MLSIIASIEASLLVLIAFMGRFRPMKTRLSGLCVLSRFERRVLAGRPVLQVNVSQQWVRARFPKRTLLLTAVRAWHFNGGVFAAASLSNLRLQGMGGMDVYRSDADQKLEEPPGATSTATVRNEDGGLWGGMDVLKPGSPQAALRPVRRFTSAADGRSSHTHI